MHIEKEVRYYFSNQKLPDIIRALGLISTYSHSCHETTIMYDNPNPSLSFYNKHVDGRLRLRYAEKVENPLFGKASNQSGHAECLVTWKRRLPDAQTDAIRREEELEFAVAAHEFKSARSIFEGVLRCKRVSSYERTRNFFVADHMQITCDQFPFGLMIEFELKDNSQEQALIDAIKKIGFRLEDASALSCDDMYYKLCREQSIQPLADITFSDKTMPIMTK